MALCAASDPGHGHALLERSEPSAGTVIASDRAPRTLSLWFTEPVKVTSNGVAVLNSDNRRVERLNARLSDQEPSRVDVDLSELADGAYLVRWRVISADDHVVRGAFWFVVGFAATPPPSAQLLGTGKPLLSFTEIAARWLGLLALLGMTGIALFRLAVPGLARIAAPALERPVLLGAVTLFLVAHLLLAVAQAEAVAELPVPQALTGPVLGEVLFSGRFAMLWWLRLGLDMLLGVLLYRRSDVRLTAVVGALLLIATALSVTRPARASRRFWRLRWMPCISARPRFGSGRCFGCVCCFRPCLRSRRWRAVRRSACSCPASRRFSCRRS